MPLALLLDENISLVVAEQITLKRPDIAVQSIHLWREGVFLSAPDDAILEAACQENLTLVTYDTQILSDLAFWFEQGLPFAGIIFVDEATIPGKQFGALIRALIYLWDRERDADWRNRLIFLPADPHRVQ